jgi:protocatechuate 3,4-dioxygenase alpha subunit
MTLIPTPSQTVGPFLHLGLTDSGAVGCIAGEGVKGERIRLKCRVLDGEGAPVPDAMIELWQADADGYYACQEDSRTGVTAPEFRGFGRMPTGDDGTCTFETIKPARVPFPGGGLQAPHVNVSILGRGLLLRLCTRIYFAGDPANGADPGLALVPENRRATLMAQPDSSQQNSSGQETFLFEIRLRGAGETVFFDW